jgi:hypothetical protein
MQIALFQMPEMPDPFRKAVPAIHIAPKTGPISLQQAKTWNALIKNAIEQRKEGERTWFEYSIGDLISDVGLNSKIVSSSRRRSIRCWALWSTGTSWQRSLSGTPARC